MTDFEAVYEKIMKKMMVYARVNYSDIDSQTKLERFLEQNDRLNRITTHTLMRLVNTNKAQDDIKKAQEGRNSEEILEARKQKAEENDERERIAKAIIIASGKQPVATHTTKTGVRVVLFKNSSQIDVYALTDKRGRKTLRNPATGRITKK